MFIVHGGALIAQHEPSEQTLTPTSVLAYPMSSTEAFQALAQALRLRHKLPKLSLSSWRLVGEASDVARASNKASCESPWDR